MRWRRRGTPTEPGPRGPGSKSSTCHVFKHSPASCLCLKQDVIDGEACFQAQTHPRGRQVSFEVQVRPERGLSPSRVRSQQGPGGLSKVRVWAAEANAGLEKRPRLTRSSVTRHGLGSAEGCRKRVGLLAC